MSTINIEDPALYEITLQALVNSLQRNGYDLDKIFADYDREILDNRLSGASAERKSQSSYLLSELIKEAKVNSELR